VGAHRLGLLFVSLLLALGAIALPLSASAAIPLTCGTQGTMQGTGSRVVDVRVGHHTEEGGFDRIVWQFEGPGIPPWQTIPKSSAVFYRDPSGQRVPLEGTAGIKVVLQGVPSGTYTGPQDFDPEFHQLAEAALIGDFENVTSWAIGLERQSCKRVFTLGSPTPRLVIDVPD
jgi:hypothetical protein